MKGEHDRIDYDAVTNHTLRHAIERAMSARSLNPKKFSPPQVQTIMDDLVIIASEGLTSPDDKTFEYAARALIDYGNVVPSTNPENQNIFEYNGPNREIFSRAVYASANQLDTLVNYITDESKGSQMRSRQEHAINLINLMAMKDVGEEVNVKALEIYECLISTIIGGMLTGKFNFDHALQIYTEKSPNVWPQVFNEIKTQMNDISSGEFRPRLQSFLQSPQEDTRIKGKALARILLKRCGFSPREIDKLFNDWTRDLWPWREVNYLNVDSNIDAIFELEQSVPGIAKYLLTQFGIKHLGRYSTKLILDQYNSAEDQTNPWGVIIYPHGDWNGSFHHYRHVLNHFGEQFDTLYQATGCRYRVRIIEVGNLSDLEKKALFLQGKYGPASFAIIGGHGSPNEIRFGHTRKGNEKIKREELGSGKETSQAIKNLFLPDAPIALFSCSTGVENGMAQTLSEFGVLVIGPDASSHTVHILVKEDKGKLQLKVLYREAKAREYVNGKPK